MTLSEALNQITDITTEMRKELSRADFIYFLRCVQVLCGELKEESRTPPADLKE